MKQNNKEMVGGQFHSVLMGYFAFFCLCLYIADHVPYSPLAKLDPSGKLSLHYVALPAYCAERLVGGTSQRFMAVNYEASALDVDKGFSIVSSLDYLPPDERQRHRGANCQYESGEIIWSDRDKSVAMCLVGGISAFVFGCWLSVRGVVDGDERLRIRAIRWVGILVAVLGGMSVYVTRYA